MINKTNHLSNNLIKDADLANSETAPLKTSQTKEKCELKPCPFGLWKPKSGRLKICIIPVYYYYTNLEFYVK